MRPLQTFLALALLASASPVRARVPSFRAVALERKAETTANASLGDLDGDGDLDIVIGDQARGGAFVFFNQGGLTFSDPVQIAGESESVYSIAAAHSLRQHDRGHKRCNTPKAF
ncbi:MAG: FG-GAP-like repeat-containing protein [Acidobacteria bacterium]|nr:FG-GAP-like repeat-containing protein [Acidobacteriota bacterium]